MSEIPESQVKKVARNLANRGTEITPEQVREAQKGAWAKIRKKAVSLGLNPPEGDAELLEWMKSIGLGR